MTGGITVNKKSTLEQLREEERYARKELIMNAAILLFSTNSISNVGMRDIAKEAGISAALIYRHFKDRDTLFLDIFLKKSEELISNFKQVIAKNPNISPEIVGKEFVSYLLSNDLFFRMMTHFMLDRSIDRDHIERLNDMIRQILKIFDQTFANVGLSEKEDIRLYSHAFFAALNGVIITFYKYPGRSEDELKKHILSLTSILGSLFNPNSQLT